MRRVPWLFVGVVAALVVVADPVAAHDGLGRAQPRVDTTVTGSGSTRTLLMRLTDMDSGNAVTGAIVRVSAGSGEGARVAGAVSELGPGLFRSRLRLPQPGRWRVDVAIGGSRVVPTSFSADVDVGDVAALDDRPSGGGSDIPLLVLPPVGLVVVVVLVFAAVRARRVRARQLSS
jgi:hypothetical protein